VFQPVHGLAIELLLNGDVRHGRRRRRPRWSIFVTDFSDEYTAPYRHGTGFQFSDVSFASQAASPSIRLVG